MDQEQILAHLRESHGRDESHRAIHREAADPGEHRQGLRRLYDRPGKFFAALAPTRTLTYREEDADTE